MSVFPTNKTVPLDKDIGVANPKTQSLGITGSREQLSVVLDAVDQSLANEIAARISGDNTNATNLSNHINSSTAHIAINIVNTPSGNMTQTNVQAAINSLQSSVDTKASITSLNAETTRATAAETLHQTEIDGERSPLRMTTSGTVKTVSIAAARQTRTDSSGNTSTLIVPNGSLASDFPGATIDFAAGSITYTGGVPGASAFTPINFAGQASQWAKYAILIIPGSPNTITILNGTTFASTAAGATEPPFTSGVLVGFVAVQDNGTAGSGTINNIQLTSLEQSLGSFPNAPGERSLDPQPDETFVYYTRSDFRIDNNKFVGSVSGGAVDQSLGLSKITMPTSSIFISKDLTGQQIYDDAVPINQVQARLVYNTGKIDAAPVVALSRDGGASYSTATVSFPTSDGNLVLADSTFGGLPTNLYTSGASNGGSTANVNRAAAIFTPTYRTLVTSFQMYVGTTSTSGTVSAKIYSVTSGTPVASLVSCNESYIANSTITSTASLKTFTLATPLTLQPGTAYAFSVEGTGCTVFAGYTNAGASFTSSGSTYGSGWTADSHTFVLTVAGTGADLRLKVTGSGTLLNPGGATATISGSAELAGFGMDYVYSSPISLVGDQTWEDRVLTSAEATSGLITLYRARYTPGAHQLLVFNNNKVYTAPDFTEISYSQVQFPANTFAAGQELRFWVGFGLVNGTSTVTAQLAVFYDAIVGSTGQVAAGTATHSSLQAAVTASAAGSNILVLRNTITENLTISKQVNIEGGGRNSYLNGTTTFAAGSTGASIKNMRLGGNVVFNATVDNCIVNGCWVTTGSTITNNGGNGNLYLVSQE